MRFMTSYAVISCQGVSFDAISCVNATLLYLLTRKLVVALTLMKNNGTETICSIITWHDIITRPFMARKKKHVL